MAFIKCEFHCHSGEDPIDNLSYPATQLLDKAAKEGFSFVALTLHQKVHLPEELRQYAANLGILMVPSTELSIQGRDVLAINCPEDLPQRIQSLDDLRTFKHSDEAKDTLIIAPHVHYVFGGSLGHKRLKKYADCFDAIELCHLYTELIDRGKPALRFAKERNIPAIATSDAHSLGMFGQNFCEVEIPGSPGIPEWETLRKAILENKLRNTRPPVGWPKFLHQGKAAAISTFRKKLKP